MTFVMQVDSRNTSASAIVPPEGPLDCKIAFVGEAPGAKEQAVLRPFVGPAGMELNKLLHSVGIVRSSCYITNVIKEQPKNNDITQFINVKKNFVTDAAKDYINHLKRELSECSANIIVALGNTALWALTGNYGIERWRGSIIESTLVEGRKVIGTFHPRAVIGPTGVFIWKHLISFDLARAMRESEFPDIRHPAMRLQVRPSFEEAISYLEECAQQDIIDVDIETLRNEVSCISFSYSNSSSISIPMTAEHGDYWQPDQEVEIFRKIAEVLENPEIVKRGQNFLFDMFFLWRRHGIRTTNILDTMVAQAILFPDFKKGLDFITSIHTDIPYYKDEGKQWNRITGSWEQHWLYNCKDTIATSCAYPSLMGQLGAQDNLTTFHRQNDLIESLLFMQARGIKMDVVSLKMASESVERHIERLQNELWSICGYELNPRSPAQLVEYFYQKKGIKPYVDRKTGRPTTDEKALTRLYIKGYREADLILKLRDYGKLKGTYLDVSLDEDDRMRCSYNPVGAKTGRLSSSKNIFGTGGNLQNIPPEMKEFMLFDEGYVGYEIDLSQAENRIVAYCGPVPEMIQAFEDNKDVHRLTASLMFGVPYDQVSDEPGSTHLGGGRYSQRFFGKKCNHSLNYDLGSVSFSLLLEIELREGKYLVESYHRAYPGVRNGFQRMIQDQVNRNRTVLNPMGRKRLFLDRIDDELYKSAYGHFPQSTVADIISERGLNFIYYTKNIFNDVELLLQTHDSITFQIPLSVPMTMQAELVWKIKKKLETPIEWRAHSFVIPADLKISFGSMAKGNGGYHDIKGANSLEELTDKLCLAVKQREQ